jgi:hypothetical protein
LLIKALLGPIKKLPQDVLVAVVKEFDVVLAQLYEFLALQVVRIVYNLIYDESSEVIEMSNELVESYLVYHTNCTIRHRLDSNCWRTIEDDTCFSLDGPFL